MPTGEEKAEAKASGYWSPRGNSFACGKAERRKAMRISPDLANLAEVKRATLLYDSYAQCPACCWTGCAGDFHQHRHAKHPKLAGVTMILYRE